MSEFMECAACKWTPSFRHQFRAGFWRVQWGWRWPFRRRVWVPDALLVTCPVCRHVHVREPGTHRVVPRQDVEATP